MTPTSRPLSSTLRAAREKTPNPQRAPADEFSVVVSSDGSSPASLCTSSTSVPAKRTSPHPDFGPVHKRARSAAIPKEKENLSYVSSADKGKAPARQFDLVQRVPSALNTRATPSLSIQVPSTSSLASSDTKYEGTAACRAYTFDFSFLLGVRILLPR